jgi:predicted flap endonuclease-1-like 5' DNA nuclease
MRIKGIGEEYSDLLEEAGVDTIKELRNRSAKNLHAKILEVNAKKKLVRRPPTLAQVEGWVKQAKALKPKVTH